MQDIRCKGCDKLLGQFNGSGRIKCTRTTCGGLNVFDTKKETHDFVPKMKHVPMKDRAVSSGFTFR